MFDIPGHFIEFEDKKYEFYNGQYYQKVSHMSSGTAFGELALQKEHARRKATVRAERFTELATINAQYYNKCIKKID